MRADQPQLANRPRSGTGEVDIGPRPETSPPPTLAVVEIRSFDIESMDNQRLSTWLYHNTGRWIDPSLSRTKFLTEFFREAEAIPG